MFVNVSIRNIRQKIKHIMFPITNFILLHTAKGRLGGTTNSVPVSLPLFSQCTADYNSTHQKLS